MTLIKDKWGNLRNPEHQYAIQACICYENEIPFVTPYWNDTPFTILLWKKYKTLGSAFRALKQLRENNETRKVRIFLSGREIKYDYYYRIVHLYPDVKITRPFY